MIRGFVLLLLASVGVWTFSVSEGFSQSNPFARLVGREAERPDPAVWYERADGRGRFILDQSNSPTLLWPEGSEEVLAVFPSRAAGGGDVWMTDNSRVILRISNLGGATFFPLDAPDGVIVEEVGRAQTLVPAPSSDSDLQSSARRMVNQLSQRSRNEVSAQITDLSPLENAYLIDAMDMIELAIDDLSRRDLRDLNTVRIGIGESARVTYSQGVLDLSVAPERGYGGRPSSDSIRRAIQSGR